MAKLKYFEKKADDSKLKHKVKHWWLSYFVRDVMTINTGGNVWNDVLYLSNGQVVAITDEVISLYATAEDYEDNTQNYKMILRNK
jgi:hypothetical protein